MKKKGISVNLTRIAGAIYTTREDGTRVLHFELDAPTELRAKVVANKDARLPPNVYLKLDVVDNSSGPDTYGNDCFVAEPVSQEERQRGLKLYVGNGRTYEAAQQAERPKDTAPKRAPRAKTDWGAEFDEGVDPEPTPKLENRPEIKW